MVSPIRPDGDPAGIVEKGVGKDPSSGVVLARVKGANFHGRDLLLTGCLRHANREISANCRRCLARTRRSSRLPVHSPDYDLVAELEGRLFRVQVKDDAFRKGRWDVTVCTRGGNQSWNGSRRGSIPRFDYLFVLVGDGRRWFIPSDSVGGRPGLLLGGPKYAEFEVEQGDPIPETISVPPLQSASA